MKGKTRSGTKKTSGFPDSRFISLQLTADDSRRLESLVEGGKLSLDMLLDTVREGLKLSFSRDSKNDTFVASLSSAPTEIRTHYVILTGRGHTPADAALSLAYKHFVLTEEVWDSYDVPENSFDRFG